ncbi:CYTH domain-containing protein [Flagellimonas marinaquae]|uniref:CYTH domain-containing protein n=1 Tax=Flagellimonas aurea TaxID=2915619 RepID=A0ABS3FZQ8_9FLAO|nr:CYTH domain-containing protein [Allomuricauda aurea]MAO16805.1 adenylate cyclase [Allomuricauda sp.]MBC71670.1 adenylate cyclase [Allomuricauda sp.]MBO0352620.1 CYTH domain-containing protein [Allomuricauda aurea]UBZ15627.1 CYTH domain-containing protein [Allomuricauda aquimarina]|tara:strand:- start:3159 stop:3632 length:474 start_codon:yes stop_codon:yes gene_type:complete
MEHLEIERKFLVNSDAFKQQATSQTRIVQGFLNTDPERTVRVRIRGEKGFLTVKGASNESGTTRFEWETEISAAEAANLIDLCEAGILEKVRFEVPLGKHMFEVDEFLGENKGLILAEVELKHEDERFERPDWLGQEVTGQVQYYNSQLSIKPYKEW